VETTEDKDRVIAKLKSLIADAVWKKTSLIYNDILASIYLEDGSRITILDRMTGFGGGQRDTETGYKDAKGDFWLASGMFDIRDEQYCKDKPLTVEAAVALIKRNANTCNPNRKEEIQR